MTETVQVLLSSYNGEKYLGEQLDSILAQEGVQVSLLVRDDGSIDGTRKILEHYRSACKNITVIYGENIGAAKSFFELMEAAGEASYIAFSDQDDVWLPDKLARAVRLLKEKEKEEREVREKCRKELEEQKAGGRECGPEASRKEKSKKCSIPLVYCSAAQPVDAELKPLKQAIRYPKVRTEFGNALVENMCTGCTCVVNQELLRLIRGRTPEFTIMHDFWIYLVGTCFGAVIYDEESRIFYRQHEGNEIGAAGSVVENYKRRVQNYRKHRGQLGRQAAELVRIYGDSGWMPGEKRELAGELIRAGTDKRIRKKLLRERRVFRQRRSDDRIFRVLLAAGKV